MSDYSIELQISSGIGILFLWKDPVHVDKAVRSCGRIGVGS